MLEPITKKMTDASSENEFRFIFYCDICGDSWACTPVKFNHPPQKTPEAGEDPCSHTWNYDHIAAYERANLEAMQHFNRCPECRRWVCDKCFRILEDRDVCKWCAER